MNAVTEMKEIKLDSSNRLIIELRHRIDKLEQKRLKINNEELTHVCSPLVSTQCTHAHMILLED